METDGHRELPRNLQLVFQRIGRQLEGYCWVSFSRGAGALLDSPKAAAPDRQQDACRRSGPDMSDKGATAENG